MWAYIFRRLLYNIPVYLGIILFVMVALRVNDPVPGFLGKNKTQEDYDAFSEKAGLNRPFIVQYVSFLGNVVTLDFKVESWEQPGVTVGELLRSSVGPSLSLTLPALIFTSFISICVGMISAFHRGRWIDRILVIGAVMGMSISFLVYIIIGQHFGAYSLNELTGQKIFAIQGYESGIANWPHYCLLPVMISVIVAMGYDTRFYRAAMVEETGRDYIITARSKGASQFKIMFVHMLRNAMIPIITRIMITIPFLLTGSILLELYFSIPGMGQTLIQAIRINDFPIIQCFTAMFAGVFIVTNVITDVLYALVDPRIRLT